MAVPRRGEFYPFQQIFPKDTTKQNGPVKVVKAQHQIDDQWYAIKQILAPDVRGEREARREIRAMAKFDHPNIVTYSDSWYSDTDIKVNRNLNEFQILNLFLVEYRSSFG